MDDGKLDFRSESGWFTGVWGEVEHMAGKHFSRQPRNNGTQGVGCSRLGV